MDQKYLALVCAGLVALTLTGCDDSSESQQAIGTSYASDTTNGSTIVLSTVEGSGREAGVRGEVFTTSTGCVSLRQDDGSEYSLVWPVGTTLASDGASVILADGRQVVEGSTIDGGGGYVMDAYEVEGFPEECKTSAEEVAVLSTVESVH